MAVAGHGIHHDRRHPDRDRPLADVDERTPVRVLAPAPGYDARDLVRRILNGAQRRIACVAPWPAATIGPDLDSSLSDDRVRVLRAGHVCSTMEGHDAVAALNRLPCSTEA